VRHQDRLDLAVADCFEIRQRILPGVFRVHPAIEEEPVMADLKVVRIGPDLCVPCEIREFQGCSRPLLLLLVLLLCRERICTRFFGYS
jgi:hypothetical protein